MLQSFRAHAQRVAPSSALTRLAIAICVLNLGATITTVALPVLIVERYGFGAELAESLALRLIPLVLAGGFFAWLLSLADARYVAVASLVGAGATALLFPLASDVWQINIVSAANGLAIAGAGPALMALRSSVVSNDQLTSGNGLIVLAERIPQVGGPLIVAGVLTFSDVATLFIAEALATLAATSLIARLPKSTARSSAPFFSRRNAEMWMSLLRNRRVQGYVLTGLFYTSAAGAMRLVLVSAATTIYSGTRSALPLLLAAIAVGAVLGGSLGFLIPARAIGLIYVLGNALEALVLFGFGLTSSLVVAMALLVASGVFEAIATTAFFADIQSILTTQSTGPFFALYIPAISGATVVGTLIGPVLATQGTLAGTTAVALLIIVPLVPFLGSIVRSRAA